MIIVEKPGILDLECVAGDTFQRTLTIDEDGTPLNMTGWHATLTAKLSIVGNPKFSLSDTGGEITLGNGTLSIAIDDAITNTYRHGAYWYQLRVADATDAQTILEGNFTVKERQQ